MAVQFENNVSEWSRTTAADGNWLNKNTIQPLIERTEILRDAINDMTGSSVPELKAQLETEKQVRAEADTAEHTVRSEADDALRRDIDGLSEQIGDTINLVEGPGIKLDEVDGGQTLKISANYNDGDNTTYGIFSSTSGAGYGKGGWELTESNGNLTTDHTEILGLKDNKVYHIEISGHFVVNTPNDTIISAYLLDSNGKKLYFNVDTSNSELVVPVSFAYSFIPTTNLDTTTGTYKYKLMKWTSMDEDGHEDTEAEENAISLFITDISIHEVANKTISVSIPDVKLYGLANNPPLVGSTTVGEKILPIDGTAMTGNTEFQIENNSIKIKSSGIYNCNAVVVITGSGALTGNETFTFTVPYSNSGNMSFTHILDISKVTNTVCICWQAADCTHLNIKVDKLPLGLSAKIEYIQYTETI